MKLNVYGLGRKMEKLFTSDMVANIRKSQTTRKLKKKRKRKTPETIKQLQKSRRIQN